MKMSSGGSLGKHPLTSCGAPNSVERPCHVDSDVAIDIVGRSSQEKELKATETAIRSHAGSIQKWAQAAGEKDCRSWSMWVFAPMKSHEFHLQLSPLPEESRKEKGLRCPAQGEARSPDRGVGRESRFPMAYPRNNKEGWWNQETGWKYEWKLLQNFEDDFSGLGFRSFGETCSLTSRVKDFHFCDWLYVQKERERERDLWEASKPEQTDDHSMSSFFICHVCQHGSRDVRKLDRWSRIRV